MTASKFFRLINFLQFEVKNKSFLFLKILSIEIIGSEQPINLKLLGKFSNRLNPTIPHPIRPIFINFFLSLNSS